MSSERDIVEQLRNLAWDDWTSELLDEAADEIESLRRAVKAMAREIEGLKGQSDALTPEEIADGAFDALTRSIGS